MLKDFDQKKDIVLQRSTVTENINLPATFFSSAGTNFYTKNYFDIASGSGHFLSGGYFSTVYDGSPTSFSSSALIDLTFGISVSSSLASYSQTFLKTEKKRVYEEMAEKLLGNKSNIFEFNGNKYNDLFFLALKRRIFKDEIDKQTLNLNIEISGTTSISLSLKDNNARTSFTIGSAGDESFIFDPTNNKVGKIYYNAGVIVFHTGAFLPVSATKSVYWSGSTANNMDLNQLSITGTIDQIVDGLKNRINSITLDNKLNLQKSAYFCRANNNEFNYSTNPTFVNADPETNIVTVTTTANGNKVIQRSKTFITKVGLYDINNNLLAIACLQGPVSKDYDTELVIRAILNW